LRLARLLFAGVVVVFATSSAASASAMNVVRPTGQFPADLTNVQAAVNEGGTVLLAATDSTGQARAFNFGPAVRQSSGGRGVDIAGNVTVTGQHSGDAVATIDGGDIPFFVRPGANVAITGITFDAPFYIGIELDHPATANVNGNRIEHVVGFFVSPSVGFGTGIDAAFGGNIKISGNVIDDVNAPFAHGISQGFARGDVQIAGNQVSQTNEIAIESGPQVLGTSTTGITRIVGNTVAPGPQRYPRGAAGTGIEANGAGNYVINGNTATCVNRNAVCIFVFGTTGFFTFGPVVAPRIEGNVVTAGADGVDGIGLVGQVSQGQIAGNQLSGLGEAAFVLFGCTCGTKSDIFDNTFTGNDIANFTSTLADVFMDPSTHNNVYRGECRTVIDLGTANQITCTNGSAGGQQASSATQASADGSPLKPGPGQIQAPSPQRP
jgi:hypothetical protein